MDRSAYRQFIEETIRESGKIAMEHFGNVNDVRVKADPAQVVTEVDVASEKYIISRVEEHFPAHSIIAEESGLIDKDSDYVWVIDPLDGTSNYAQGIGWFGIMLALLYKKESVATGIYLPSSNEMYSAVKGEGAFKNGSKFIVRKETMLRNCLVSYSADTTEDEGQIALAKNMYANLLPKVRNLRATNSALDYVYAAEGKLGALVSHKNMLWDAAPIVLIAEEAGCIVSDITGDKLSFDLGSDGLKRSYSLVIAQEGIYEEIIKLIDVSSTTT